VGLAARGAREGEHGAEPITDRGTAERLRAQARRVFLETGMLTAMLLVAAIFLPG
jgi:hypothetical protein